MKQILTLIALCVLNPQLQAQVSFTLSSSPHVGSQARSVVAADVNGDGKVDLVSGNNTANSFSVLTNNGNGGFVLASTPGVSTPVSVTAADVNSDGKLDLACANAGDNTLSVMTNNGSGDFVLASAPGVGSDPFSVVAADVNGDGKLDLINANLGDNTLTVLTNNGSGGFMLASTLGVGSAPSSVTAVDVNGDGKLDLINANAGVNTLSVLTNDGSGGFVLASTLNVGSFPVAVTAADVNGDGKVDLISANRNANTLSVLSNDGSGGFVLASTAGVGSSPSSVTAADINGDGKVDLVSANVSDSTLSVLTNDGSGGFVLASTPGAGFSPRSGVAADVNGDGKLDLISANVDNTLSVLMNATPFPPSSRPLITGQPTGRTNLVGTTATFSVGATATGTEPARHFSYQWRLAGTNLPAATNNVLILTNLTLSQSGNSYDVVITNYVGSVTSSPVATLIVYVPATIITTQPTNQIVPFGASASFGVIASGFPAPTSYQWTHNATNLTGATSNVFNILHVHLSDLGNYQVLVSNGYSSTNSDIATLNMSPSLTAPFGGAITIWGRSAVLSVGAIGSGELVYQWYQDGVVVDGQPTRH